MNNDISPILAMTMGENVQHWNVFRKNRAESLWEVPVASLSPDALVWLREHQR